MHGWGIKIFKNAVTKITNKQITKNLFVLKVTSQATFPFITLNMIRFKGERVQLWWQ
jgi:hypothetical protein